MTAQDFELFIGDKNWSSWSLRPWLLMRQAGIPFKETCIRLRQEDTKAQILAVSPSGTVPALRWKDTVITDSLAICETIADLFPDHRLWPDDKLDRAIARSAAAEMHSGFQGLRRSEEALAGAQRIVTLWKGLRRRFAGGAEDQGLLCGRFSIVDAMYAPVVTRFRTYGVDLAALGDDGTAAAYMDAVFALPAMKQWIADAEAEEKVKNG
jgi:glutathione S-transferase